MIRGFLGKKTKLICLLICLVILSLLLSGFSAVNKMPYYNLNPKPLVVRSSFYTTYASSSAERKHNIELASSKLNNTFIDVGGEFSFNFTVGARTEKNGYKVAKVILDGKFVEGLGGGICQVSTTLYNAVLLSELKITEYHAHSLPVSYVAPSFDAMVSYGLADLKFINNTYNPIIIKTHCDGSIIRISIIGESNLYKIVRKSQFIEYLPAPKEQVIVDTLNEYPFIKLGERRVIFYSSQGLRSQGSIEKYLNGKLISEKKIREDVYKGISGLIVEGTAVTTEEINGF